MTPPSPLRARWAVTLIFFLHGVVVGAWVPHIPLAKERLAAGPAVFGLALLALAAGAVVAMPLAGVLINRFGSARMTALTGILFCLSFLGPVAAPGLAAFMTAGAVFGMAIGSLDVSMNAHGLAVEKAIRVPTMSLFHGGFSLGGMAGAFAGAALLKAAGPLPQALLTSAVSLALLLAAIRFLLPPATDRGLSGSHFAWPSRAALALGMQCFLALMVEGSVLDWAAIMMRERFDISPSFAATAFGFYQGGMALARLLGDRLRLAFGAVRLVRVSALLAGAGTAVALLAPAPLPAIAAFAIAGLGIGNVAPILFAGGGRLEPTAPGRGIAAVTTLGYAGFLSGPPLIGITAQAAGLAPAMFLTVAAAFIIARRASMVDAADTF